MSKRCVVDMTCISSMHWQYTSFIEPSVTKRCCSVFLREPNVEASLWVNITFKPWQKKPSTTIVAHKTIASIISIVLTRNPQVPWNLRLVGHQFSLTTICLELLNITKKFIARALFIWICVINITFDRYICTSLSLYTASTSFTLLWTRAFVMCEIS